MQATAIFRIFQEALTNILRHAQASRVEITMEEDDDEFVLRIRDKLHNRPSIAAIISRTARSIPTSAARATILCPMLSSSIG